MLLDVEDDPSVKVKVLTGAGKGFCAGGDIGGQKETAEKESLERKNYLFRHVYTIALMMDKIDKPTIAAINGPARGAGFDMALMCDLRIMAQSATVAESYISVGLIAGDGDTYYLPRLIGMSKAMGLYWTGRVVTADEAERMGIANRVVADDRLLPAIYELARQIAEQPFEAVRAYKRAAHHGAEMSLAAHLIPQSGRRNREGLNQRFPNWSWHRQGT